MVEKSDDGSNWPVTVIEHLFVNETGGSVISWQESADLVSGCHKHVILLLSIFWPCVVSAVVVQVYSASQLA